MPQAAAPLRTEYPKTMGIIHQQPGIMTLAQIQQCSQGSNIAIHAEDGIGDHQFAPAVAFGQQACQGRRIAVWIDLEVARDRRAPSISEA